MRYLLFNLGSIFGSEAERPRSEADLMALLRTLAHHDLRYLITHPKTPSLFTSGVVYRPEVNREEWQSIEEMRLKGFGDCEDLTAWSLAERWLHTLLKSPTTAAVVRLAAQGSVRGYIELQRYIDAHSEKFDQPDYSFRREGPFSKYHVFLKLVDGQKFDPSALLGMGVNRPLPGPDYPNWIVEAAGLWREGA